MNTIASTVMAIIIVIMLYVLIHDVRDILRILISMHNHTDNNRNKNTKPWNNLDDDN